MNEAETCRKFVVPKLQAAGWDNEPHSIAEQRTATDFLKKHDRFAKTVVFCVDQEHADEMRRALNNLNSDLVGSTGNLPVPVGNLPTGTEGAAPRGRTFTPPHAPPIPPGKLPGGAGRLPAPPLGGAFPDYVCRGTSDNGDIGRVFSLSASTGHYPLRIRLGEGLGVRWVRCRFRQHSTFVLKVPPVSDHGQIGDITKLYSAARTNSAAR